MISGTLAGVAAVVYTSGSGKAQNITGIGWELDAIAAVVIGGTLLTGGAGYVARLGHRRVRAGPDERAHHPGRRIRPEMTTIITGGILLVFVLLQRASPDRGNSP